MAIDVTVVGDTDKLVLLARATRDLGDRGLRRELFGSIQRAARPLRAAAAASALESLPQRGGLNRRVAASKFSVRTRTGGRDPGVRIVASGGLDLRSINRGRLRHPVFGNRKVWVNQSIQAGWFTEAMEKGSPAVREELRQVFDRVAAQLVRITHG